MSYNVIATEPFEKKIKKLLKKHASIKDDLLEIIDLLEENPTFGIHIGKGCYKIRMSITSTGKGKRAGARLITYVRIVSI